MMTHCKILRHIADKMIDQRTVDECLNEYKRTNEMKHVKHAPVNGLAQT
jgi:hypothetical protein